MPEYGADPGQLDSLATQFKNLADELDGRSSHLNIWIEADRFWRGRRADEFRQAWEHTYRPQLSAASSCLNSYVDVLHRNANQQRTASGEQPKDYNPPSFLDKLFNGAVKAVEDTGKEISHDISDVLKSKEFTEVLGGLQVVSDVAGLVALLPIPPVDAIAAAVSVGAGGLVLAGHLAQMANSGKFTMKDLGQVGVDVVGLLPGIGKLAEIGKAAVTAEEGVDLTEEGMTAAKAAEKFADAEKVVDETPDLVLKMGGAANKITDGALSVASKLPFENQVKWAPYTVQHIVPATSDYIRTVHNEINDVSSGHWAQAADDALGVVKTGADLVAPDAVSATLGMAQDVNNVPAHMVDNHSSAPQAVNDSLYDIGKIDTN